jgi:hypothetical protein
MPNVSLFASTTATVPELRFGLSWPALVELLGPPKSRLAKDAAPLYSPAEWLPGKTRGKEGIAALHFGVLDIDHWRPSDIEALVTDLMHKGVSYYLVSTWSNGAASPEDVCARLVLPFSRPALPSEWPVLWSVLNESHTRGMADAKCKDVSRSYYFPSFCEGRALGPFHDARLDGQPVDVDALLANRGVASYAGVGAVAGVPDPVRPGVANGFDRERVKAIAISLSRSQKEHKAFIGGVLLRVCKGEQYAREPGTIGSIFDTGVVLPEGRNDTTFKAVATLVEHFPHADPQQIADLFAPSATLMGGPEPHEIHSMAERLLAGAKQAHANLIHESIGRYEPYTEAELQIFADRADISLAQLRRRWIVQRDRIYYLLRHDGYRAYTEAEVKVAAERELAPAITAGVDTMKITKDGTKPKSPEELVRDYGTIAGGVIVDLAAQRSYFDEATRNIIEAPCPIRVQPREHPEIDEWLRHFAGPKFPRLRQWLAALVALSEPCAALYTEGPPGVGKSLLAYGAARMWTTEGPTTLDNVMGAYNDRFSKCPFVFGDEKAPVDSQGRVRTDQLREFIQARTRPFTRKYRDTATIRGCGRIMIAANNRNLLQTSEHLTEDDIAAIVERILYIRAGESARYYLASLPPGTTDRWVEGDEIAEHALYLAHTLEVPRTGRFLVAGETSDLTNSLSVSTGLRSSVAQWLVGYLQTPKRMQQKQALLPFVKVSRGRLLVTSRAIAEAWQEYVHHDFQPPTPMAVSRALSGISTEMTMREGDKNVKFRNVKLDMLVEWAEQTGYATREDIEKALVEAENSIPAKMN